MQCCCKPRVMRHAMLLLPWLVPQAVLDPAAEGGVAPLPRKLVVDGCWAFSQAWVDEHTGEDGDASVQPAGHAPRPRGGVGPGSVCVCVRALG